MNNSEINRLGDLLRQGALTPSLLSQLDEYRRSFQAPIAEVVAAIRVELAQFPEMTIITLRPSKATPSIVAKLRRQPTLKLSQIQDIAGLRLLAMDRRFQDAWCQEILKIFPEGKVLDRRDKPSFGYRALHLVVKRLDRTVEIQIRTRLQHMWAHLSEKIADKIGHDFKYGLLSNPLYEEMLELSDEINDFELAQLETESLWGIHVTSPLQQKLHQIELKLRFQSS
jgi:putative GTP pyrophosphokinase